MMTTTATQIDDYRNTAIWKAVTGAVSDLERRGHIAVETVPNDVIGAICKELAREGVVAPAALMRARSF